VHLLWPHRLPGPIRVQLRATELRGIENREYLVKLSDGSEHRSSRTYADRLEEWLTSGKDK